MREGTGVSLGIGGIVAGFFTAVAGVIAAVTYLYVCVYAIVKLIGDRDGHPDPATLVVGFVALVSVLVLVLSVGIRFVGGSLVSRRRDDDAI
jgi:hypothetical protein